MPPRQAITPKRLFSILLLSIIGSAIISGLVGYVAGGISSPTTLSTVQTRFVDGLVQGTRFRVEYDMWQVEPKHDAHDFRAFPETRCAAKFYPVDPIAMSGCIQGLSDPPSTGYKIPKA